MANGDAPKNGNGSFLNREMLRGAGGLLNVAFLVVLTLLTYVGKGISNQLDRQTLLISQIDNRVTAIEANRFTSADGIKTQQEIMKLWQELANYPKRNEVPPPLFREQVDRMERRLETVEKSLHRIPHARPNGD